MGTGLKKVAAACGGLTAKSGSKTVKYKADGSKVAARKPRADRGKKHAAGAGRPAGTGKVINTGLHGRIANLDAWLTLEKDIIKAAGIAKAAKLTARVLQSMREGSRVLSEVEIAAVETACKPRGYAASKTY